MRPFKSIKLEAISLLAPTLITDVHSVCVSPDDATLIRMTIKENAINIFQFYNDLGGQLRCFSNITGIPLVFNKKKIYIYIYHARA